MQSYKFYRKKIGNLKRQITIGVRLMMVQIFPHISSLLKFLIETHSDSIYGKSEFNLTLLESEMLSLKKKENIFSLNNE